MPINTFLWLLAKTIFQEFIDWFPPHKKQESVYTQFWTSVAMLSATAYHPKSYQEWEFQQLFLFHKLGSIAVAEIAH